MQETEQLIKTKTQSIKPFSEYTPSTYKQDTQLKIDWASAEQNAGIQLGYTSWSVENIDDKNGDSPQLNLNVRTGKEHK